MKGLKSDSNLESILKAAHFAVTATCKPPAGTNSKSIKKDARTFKNYVDAVNITDNAWANVQLSSWAASIIMMEASVEPTLLMTCRDKNRLALQSDILGISAMGVKNILCVSGHHQSFGNHPGAKNVYDMDSVQLIAMVKKMRDEGKFINEEDIDGLPRLFIGAVSNPFAEPFEFRVFRLAKKIAAGADFIQTQSIFNMEEFKEFMKKAVDMGLHEKCHIMAGITPLISKDMALHMARTMPGVDIPEFIINRFHNLNKKAALKEGVQLAVEQIETFKEMEGVSGVHILSFDKSTLIPEIIRSAGLLPRPRA
jgi:methylenetetrahydrofolate reductase (NADPH)